MKAKLLKTDRTMLEITPKDGVRFTLAELQGYVGGWIEVVPVKSQKGALLIVNEEGRLLGLPLNTLATEVYHNGAEENAHLVAGGQWLAGDCVLCLEHQFA